MNRLTKLLLNALAIEKGDDNKILQLPPGTITPAPAEHITKDYLEAKLAELRLEIQAVCADFLERLQISTAE